MSIEGGKESKITTKVTKAEKKKLSGGSANKQELVFGCHWHCLDDLIAPGMEIHNSSVVIASQTPGGYMTIKNIVSNNKVKIMSLTSPIHRRHRESRIDG
jgi:hypothetical protein